ncbi:hypothetical protein [Niallia taxi]|uniref:Uncharacterized protein n=1 Tax=Niallia taxi TaxID=2499688 RepID=A0A437K4A9_9BACI|nr:hypothetical protein [Niallia taxi]RVT57223.1 hypothetical protein EM808_25130 [Niallia taxi]
MKKEKMIADELQCMYLEGRLVEFDERYINKISRKLRTGDLSLNELIRDDSILKKVVLEAFERLYL